MSEITLDSNNAPVADWYGSISGYGILYQDSAQDHGRSYRIAYPCSIRQLPLCHLQQYSSVPECKCLMHPIWFSRGGFLPPPAKSISEHVYKHFLELMRAASCSVTFRFNFAMDVMVFKHLLKTSWISTVWWTEKCLFYNGFQMIFRKDYNLKS